MELQKIFYSRAETAALLCLSLRTIDNLVSRKELTVRRVGRKVLFHRDELVRFARKDHPSSSPTAHSIHDPATGPKGDRVREVSNGQ